MSQTRKNYFFVFLGEIFEVVGGLLAFFTGIGSLLVLVGAILMLIGIIKIRKENAELSIAFWILIGLILLTALGVILGFVGFLVVTAIITILSPIVSIAMNYFLLKGSAKLTGDSKISRLYFLFLALAIVGIVISILYTVGVFGSPARPSEPRTFADIMNLVGDIVGLAGDVVFAVIIFSTYRKLK